MHAASLKQIPVSLAKSSSVEGPTHHHIYTLVYILKTAVCHLPQMEICHMLMHKIAVVSSLLCMMANDSLLPAIQSIKG